MYPLDGVVNRKIRSKSWNNAGMKFPLLVPGVPTSFGYEFSINISKFRNGKKTRESLFTV